MNKSILISALLCLVLSAPAPAQPDSGVPRRYVRFPIDPDFEKLFKKRLQLEQRLEPLKDLIKQIANHPERLNIDVEKLKGIKLDDDDVKKELQKWAAGEPDLKKTLGEWVKKNSPGKEAKGAEQLQKIDSILKKAETTTPEPDPLERPTKPADAAKPGDETLSDAVMRAMKDVETTRLGDWLRESPALQRAVEDLQKSMKNAPASRPDWSRWTDRLRLPEGKLMEIGSRTLERLKDLPRPTLERWTGKVNLPVMDRFRAPDVNLPAFPQVSTPPLPSLSKGASWLLLIALFVLVGWQVLRWGKRAPAAEDERARLGPWPVQPENVATRADLVRAFDYLALLTLGLNVQSWNHRAIAQRWSRRFPSCTQNASALANLYEQARYTEGVEALRTSERDQARHSLRQLAEAL